MILATGISAVRHGALPRWLAWASVVLGVVALTPVFFALFFLGPLWLLVLGVYGMRAATRSAPAAA